MREYKPAFPFNVPMYLLIPDVNEVKGVFVKTYPAASSGELIYCSFKTFGGTEAQNNGILSVVDTAVIETWFRPDIKANCRLCLAENTEKIYEILGTPENINMQNQFLKFKVQSVSGGA